jgi:hypothetical protein
MLADLDYHNHLPSYRSLLNPTVRYDYKTHSVIPLSQNDYNSWFTNLRDKDNRNLSFKTLNRKDSNTVIKMKYKSLLGDVSRSILKCINATGGQAAPGPKLVVHITQLPAEIVDYVFFLVDSRPAYRACLTTSRFFYYFAKPYFYREVSFTSTYRMAQFVAYLRLNRDVGQYVVSVDLSGIRPGYDDAGSRDDHPHDDDDDSRHEDRFRGDETVLAGWRDWKFKNNPLYSTHPLPSTHLTNVSSHSQVSTYSSNSHTSTSSINKLRMSFRYLKRKKPSCGDGAAVAPLLPPPPDKNSTHPTMNKFLMNYSTSKDVPVGYILHLINLCPNVAWLNLGSLSMSTDYQIAPNMVYKYQTFDLMYNYRKDLVTKIDRIMSDDQNTTSSASSVYSVGAFSPPIRKYNSLLPPLPPAVTDVSYIKKGDGKVYLCDLNLKAINSDYLRRVDETEVLTTMLSVHTRHGVHTNNRLRFNFHSSVDNLKYINLTSMIWLNKTLVREFIAKLVENRPQQGDFEFDDEESEDEGDECNNHETHLLIKQFRKDLILDFTDSGMYKLLPWAKRINLNTYQGCKLAYRLVNDVLYDPFDEYMRRERIRRGRMGENYLY